MSTSRKCELLGTYDNPFSSATPPITNICLFHSQLLQGNSAHFELLSSRDTPDCTKYASLVEKQQNEFSSRFCDFKKHSASYSIFARPFDVDVETAPEDLQLELIEMQSSSNLESAFKKTQLQPFYRDNVPSDKYPCLHRHAVKMTSLFGSSYLCEQLFSRMMYTKSRQKFDCTSV